MRNDRFDLAPRHWAPLLALIVVVGMGLRIVYASGFIATDDAEYARAAYGIATGTFSRSEYLGPPVFPERFGIVLPTALMFKLFGPNEWSLAAYPLLISLGLLLLLYAFTAKAFGHYAGLLATGMWSVLQIELLLSTQLRPDIPSAAYSFLGVFTIYLMRQRENASHRKLLLGGLGAGLAFGFAWLCKESVVYFIPFCLLVLGYDIYRRGLNGLWLWSGVAAGSLLVLGTELIYYHFSTGNWLYRIDAIETNYDLYPNFFYGEGSRFGYEAGTSYWKGLVKRLFLDGPAMIFLSRDFMYLPLMGAIAAAYAWYRRDTRYTFVALLLLSLLFMFNFSSASLEEFQPLPLFTRYLYPLCFPGAVLAGGLLADLTSDLWSAQARRQRPERLFWGLALAAFVGMAAGWSTFRTIRDRNWDWAAAERDLAAGIITAADRIYTDPLSRNALEFFWGYPDMTNVSNFADLPADAQVPCGSLVLMNASYVDWLQVNRGMWYTLEGFDLPDQIASPPEAWSRIWTNGNADLYRVDCEDRAL